MIGPALPSRRELLALATQAASAALGFGAIALVARRLSPSELGAWLLYLSISTFVEMLRGGLYSAALVRELTESPESARAGLCASGLGLATASSLPVAILAAVASLLTRDSAPLLACGAALTLVAVPGQHALAVQQAAHRFDRILWLRLVAGGAFPALLLAGVGGGSAAGTAVAHLLAQTAASLVALVYGWNGLRTGCRVKRENLQRLFGFGRFSVGTLAATSLLRGLDPWLIGLFAGPSAVAVYGLPLKLIELLEVPIRGFASTAYPSLVTLARRAGPASVEKTAAAWARRTTLLLAPLVAGLVIAAPLALRAIGGERVDSVAVLRVLCLYGLLLPLDRALGLALDAIGRPDANLRKVSIMALVNLVGDVLVLKLGAPLTAVAAVSVVMTAAGVALGRSALERASRAARRPDASIGVAPLGLAGGAHGH